MNNAEIEKSIRQQAVIQCSKSGGPGGQNVNKVNSKVTLFLALAKIEGLGDAERERVELVLRKRINHDGRLHLSSERYRDQLRNREDALCKLIHLIKKAALLPVKRKKSIVPRGVTARRLEVKQHRKLIKQNRKNAILRDN